MITPSGTIDLSRDFVFQCDVTQPETTTGDDTAATGITSMTAHISLTEGGSAVHASLSKTLAERTVTLGRYYCTFDQPDLTTHLAAQPGRTAWVVITKAGDVSTKSFRYLMATRISGDDA